MSDFTILEVSPASSSTFIDSRRDQSSTQPSRRHSFARSDTSVTDGTPQEIPSKAKKRDVITRRAHRKSRLGCLNCKTRRIKCDERKPQCTNCYKRHIRCDYINTISKNASCAEDFEPSDGSATLTSALNTSDLELMYHWTTSTCHSLSMSSSGSNSWQTEVTELGLSHSHLLHLVFALTALHLAYCRPERRKQYEAHADRHYALALSSVTKELANINPENCDAVYTSVQLICFVCWARGPQPGEYLAFGKNGRSEWLLMFRGIRTTIESLGSEHFVKSYAPKIRSKGKPLPHTETPLAFEERLNELHDYIAILSAKGKDLEDDLRGVDVLIECYKSRYGGKDGEYHVVFAWLYRMSEGFLERLQRHDPAPLIIYAHFVVLISEMERFWYIKGWTHHVMSGIWEILADEHRVWIRWPMARVGWIPPG